MLASAMLAGQSAEAQYVRGQVLDELASRPVPSAAVTLQARDGASIAQVLTDDDGNYVISVPKSGEYYVRVDALGYQPMSTPLLGVTDSMSYTVDLVLRPAALPVDPLVVTATAEQYKRWVQLLTGLNPASVLGRVIAGDEWRQLALSGRSVLDALRQADLPAATVQRFHGLCVSAGRVQCLPVYVDGMRWDSEFAATIPAHEIEAVVYLRSMHPSTLFQHRGSFHQNDPRGSGRIMIFRKGFLSR